MTSAYADFIDELEQDVIVPIQPPLDDLAPGTRAVIYLRVSSTGQVRTDYNPEGISIPAQREACLRKARELGVTVIDEYVEPGRSGTEMTKREAFQRMLARVHSQSDVDVIIIYQLSRMARNRYDDAIVMADLRKRGVTLVSATEAIDDTPVGQLMHGILATFNEYQSRQSSADIAYKMGRKPAAAALSAAPSSATSTTSTTPMAASSARSSSTPNARILSNWVSSYSPQATTRKRSCPTNSTTATYAPGPPGGTQPRRFPRTRFRKCCMIATTSDTSSTTAKKSRGGTRRSSTRTSSTPSTKSLNHA
jgi:DNA invertase Pin-like site-specific DNA recombinase